MRKIFAVEDGILVGRLLGALGSTWQVEEKLLDAVTGLAGSGHPGAKHTNTRVRSHNVPTW